MPLSSMKNSRTPSAVLSVCTPARAENGPADSRMSNAENAPYEKPCFSRRFWLRREVNDPPRMVLSTSSVA